MPKRVVAAVTPSGYYAAPLGSIDGYVPVHSSLYRCHQEKCRISHRTPRATMYDHTRSPRSAQNLRASVLGSVKR